MAETCKWPTCSRVATNGVHCYDHYRLWGPNEVKEVEDKPPEKPPDRKKPIAKMSAKAAKEDKEYKKIVKELLTEDDRCELKTPVCTGKAQGLHHKRKRGKHTLKDRKNLLRACNACNAWVEKHPTEAKDLKLVESKHRD